MLAVLALVMSCWTKTVSLFYGRVDLMYFIWQSKPALKLMTIGDGNR